MMSIVCSFIYRPLTLYFMAIIYVVGLTTRGSTHIEGASDERRSPRVRAWHSIRRSVHLDNGRILPGGDIVDRIAETNTIIRLVETRWANSFKSDKVNANIIIVVDQIIRHSKPVYVAVEDQGFAGSQ